MGHLSPGGWFPVPVRIAQFHSVTGAVPIRILGRQHTAPKRGTTPARYLFFHRKAKCISRPTVRRKMTVAATKFATVRQLFNAPGTRICRCHGKQSDHCCQKPTSSQRCHEVKTQFNSAQRAILRTHRLAKRLASIFLPDSLARPTCLQIRRGGRSVCLLPAGRRVA